LKIYSGSGEDKIGPGHYDVKFDLINRTKDGKLGNFAASKTQRDIFAS